MNTFGPDTPGVRFPFLNGRARKTMSRSPHQDRAADFLHSVFIAIAYAKDQERPRSNFVPSSPRCADDVSLRPRKTYPGIVPLGRLLLSGLLVFWLPALEGPLLSQKIRWGVMVLGRRRSCQKEGVGIPEMSRSSRGEGRRERCCPCHPPDGSLLRLAS